MLEDEVAEARTRCRDAEAVLITAGAGMGVDSGLPDFRGREGFWKAYPPYRHLGFGFVEMASPSRFLEAPELGWGFYGHRLQLYQITEPHPGFELLRRYAVSRPKGYFAFTSNVDGHFQVAGFSEDRVMECHGSIRHLQCFHSCTDAIWEVDDLEVQIDSETMRARGPLPECPACRGPARPNVLMFGDWGWNGRRTAAQERRLQAWLGGLGGCPLAILEFGAGMGVPTVRLFSESGAQRPCTTLIRVNPRETEVPAGGIRLPFGARDAIERLFGGGGLAGRSRTACK